MTVSIGIIAYNEEASIGGLIKQILALRPVGFNLDRIYLISDGSTDKTVLEAKIIKSKKIIIFAEKTRIGKSRQLNNMFKIASSDILIMLDADIKLDKNAINNLIKPFLLNKSLMLASGKIVPQHPQTFVQKVLLRGYLLMEEAKKMVKNNDAYSCTGAIRAFRKKLYKEIKFPTVTAEDIYPYFYCMDNSFLYKTIPNSIIYYDLPSSYKTYTKQMRRYLSSPVEHIKLFSKSLTDKYFTITPTIKLKALAKRIITDPLWTGLYIMFLISPKLINIITPYKSGKSIWHS